MADFEEEDSVDITAHTGPLPMMIVTKEGDKLELAKSVLNLEKGKLMGLDGDYAAGGFTGDILTLDVPKGNDDKADSVPYDKNDMTMQGKLRKFRYDKGLLKTIVGVKGSHQISIAKHFAESNN